MSQENVEIVRRGVEAWNRRDSTMWLSLGAPEIEWLPAGPAAVEQASIAAMTRCALGSRPCGETWDVLSSTSSRSADLGDPSWLGQSAMRGNPAASSSTRSSRSHPGERRPGRPLAKRFSRWQEALKAVGLEE